MEKGSDDALLTMEQSNKIKNLFDKIVNENRYNLAEGYVHVRNISRFGDLVTLRIDYGYPWSPYDIRILLSNSDAQNELFLKYQLLLNHEVRLFPNDRQSDVYVEKCEDRLIGSTNELVVSNCSGGSGRVCLNALSDCTLGILQICNWAFRSVPPVRLSHTQS